MTPRPTSRSALTALFVLFVLALGCDPHLESTDASKPEVAAPAPKLAVEPGSDRGSDFDGGFYSEGDPEIARFRDSRERLDHFLTNYLQDEWKLNPQQARPLSAWLVEYSLEYEVDPLVQAARVLRESRGRHYVTASWNSNRRIKRGGAGEYGYSQIMPFWAGKTVQGQKITREMLLSPEGNVKAGVLIYKRYADRGEGHLMALTHYNNPRSPYPNSYARSVNRIYNEIKSSWKDYLKENPPGQTTVDNRPPIKAAPVLP